MTLGEVLAYRELELHEHNEGIYTTGQHGARMVDDRHAHLTYVDHSGCLIMMPCAVDDRNAWYPMGQIVRVAAVGPAEVYPVTVDFAFSLTMLRHLNAARVRWIASHTSTTDE